MGTRPRKKQQHRLERWQVLLAAAVAAVASIAVALINLIPSGSPPAPSVDQGPSATAIPPATRPALPVDRDRTRSAGQRRSVRHRQAPRRMARVTGSHRLRWQLDHKLGHPGAASLSAMDRRRVCH